MNKANSEWNILENGNFLHVSMNDIADKMDENANRVFVRPVGEEKFEILKVEDTNYPYYTQTVCDVAHLKELDVAKACAVAKELGVGDEEKLNATSLAERLTEIIRSAVDDCFSPDRTVAGGEFYPHEIPAYIENLNSEAPLSPAEYQENKTAEEQQKDYCIAEEKANKSNQKNKEDVER